MIREEINSIWNQRQRIRFIPIMDLKVNPLNKFKEWRGDVFTTNMESIRNRGILVPLIIREDGTILDGHNRWKSAMKMGFEVVPCITVPGFTNDSEEKSYIDLVQNARRQLTKQDWYRMIIRDYGDLIRTDRRGKYKGGLASKDGIKDISSTISQRSGIPRTTVHQLILKARKHFLYLDVKRGIVTIDYSKIESNKKLYMEYTRAIEERSAIRRRIESLEREMNKIADVRYFEIHFKNKRIL